MLCAVRGIVSSTRGENQHHTKEGCESSTAQSKTTHKVQKVEGGGGGWRDHHTTLALKIKNNDLEFWLFFNVVASCKCSGSKSVD